MSSNDYTIQVADRGNDITFTANYAANTTTAYSVEHYRMNTDGSTYTKYDTDAHTGTTGGTVTLTNVDKIDYYSDKTLYPNPANSVLYLDNLDLEQLTNCRVYDSKGKLVMNIGNKVTTEKLSIGHLPSGVYFLRSYELRANFVKE
jgi:hypothetical protein